MIVTALSKCADGTDFSVINLLDENDKYFAEIFTKPKVHKIELKSRDYFKILLAYSNNKMIRIFPKGINKEYLLDISEP